MTATGGPALGPQRCEGNKHLRWVPGLAALLVFLVGLSDILTIFKPQLVNKLHKIKPFVPGTLTNVTRTSDVIVGLLLVLLALGLRRRKRRAWQAVLALLVFDIVIHFQHFPHLPARISIFSSIVAVVLLAALLFFHREFYAIGDPRTRWNVLRVFVVLVDSGRRDRPRLPLGRPAGRELLALPAAPGRGVRTRRRLRPDGPVGIRRPGRPLPPADQRARRCSRWSSPSTCCSARPSRGPGSARPTGSGSASCSTSTATGTPSATSRCATTRA